jgi:antitoxin CptB
MTGTTRSSQGLDARRRKLLYHCWHRGTREMDLIMGRFADAAIGDLNEADVDDFERLAEVPDQDLYGWLTGDVPLKADYDTEVFRRLRAFVERKEGRSGK